MKRNLKLILKDLFEILASKMWIQIFNTKQIINKFSIWHPQSRECLYSFCIVLFSYNIEYLLANSVMLITNQNFGNPNTRWRWFQKLISLSLPYHQMLKILFQNIILLKALKRWHWFSILISFLLYLLLLFSSFNCFDTQEIELIIISYSIFFLLFFVFFCFIWNRLVILLLYNNIK